MHAETQKIPKAKTILCKKNKVEAAYVLISNWMTKL